MGIIDLVFYVRAFVGFISDAGKVFRFAKKLFGHKGDAESEIKHALSLKREFQQNLKYDQSNRNAGEAIIRNLENNKEYPDTEERDSAFRISNWFKVEIKDLYHNGIEVYMSMLEYLKFDRTTKKWVKVSYKEKDEENVFSAWRVGRIPFINIKSIDWDGDEYYPMPHIYCSFNGMLRMPYEDFKYYYELENRGFLFSIDDYRPWEEELKFPRNWWMKFRVLINR